MQFVKLLQTANHCKIKVALHPHPIMHHLVGAAIYAQFHLRFFILLEIN
jgi:hypothetical protein